MLFKRSKPLNRWQSLRQYLWPKAGLERTAKYMWHRIVRLPDSPHAIAAGLAAGAAISFTPFVGLHLAGAWVLAWALRGNWLAAWIGTVIGNPWTFPFIWYATYKSGAWILGRSVQGDTANYLSLQMMVNEPVLSFKNLILPMAITGVPAGFIAGWITYMISRRLVDRYQHRRRLRIQAGRRDEKRQWQKGSVQGDHPA